MYWSIRNLGLANRALIRTATARLAATDWERTKQLNDIRAEVAVAYARTQASAALLDIQERTVTASERGFREDLQRAYAGEALPIEVLDNLRLRALAQQDYLETITGYNQAQYELYVAIGQPPADLLIHTTPPTIPPSPVADPK
jgi:outer membrane protein TolC